jgi:hypothetical protein
MSVTPACPILDHLARLEDLAQDAARTLQRLRRELKRCDSCLNAPECPLIEHIHQRLHAALNEVTEEWNLWAA